MSYSDSRRRSNSQTPPPYHDGTAGGASTSHRVQDAPRDGVEFLSRENQRLTRENREMRRCLMLVKENCELRNLNYLSHALTTTDAKLRKFLTDTVLSAPTNNMVITHVSKSSSTGNVVGPPYPTDTPGFKPAATGTSTGTRGATDSTYGQAFPELQYSEIANSFGERSVFSNSYGKSFAEIDAAELSQSYNRGQHQSQLQTSLDERSVRWVDYDSYNNVGTHAPFANVESSMKRTQSNKSSYSAPVHHRSGSLESGSRIPGPQRTSHLRTPEGKPQASEPMTGFVDSLETSHRSRERSQPMHQPPMRFSLNPNSLQQNLGTSKPIDTRRGPPGNSRATSPGRSVSPRQSSRRGTTNHTVQRAQDISQMSENNRSLRMSDLENDNRPSAFKQYKGPVKNTGVQFKNTTREYQGSSTPSNVVRTEYRSRSVTPDGTDHRAVSRAVYQGQGRFTMKGHPATCYCIDCHALARSIAQSQEEQLRKSPLSTQLFIEEEESSGSKPKVIVRVNTTLGRPDDNDGVEKVQMSDVYAIPTGTRSPTPTLLGRSVSVKKDGVADQKMQSSQWTSRGRPRSISPSVEQSITISGRSRSRSPSSQQSGIRGDRSRSRSPSSQQSGIRGDRSCSRSPSSQQSGIRGDRSRSRSPSFQQPGTSRGRSRSPSPHATRYNRSRSPMSVEMEVMRNASANTSYSGSANGSILQDRPVYTNDRSNYKTAVSFEPISSDPGRTEYRGVGTLETPRERRRDRSVSPRQGRDVGNQSTSLGSPVATSTPKQSRASPRQRLFKTELQTRQDKYTNEQDSRYNTAQSTLDHSYLNTSRDYYPGFQPIKTQDANDPPMDMTRARKSPISIELVPPRTPKQVRCSSAPPLVLGQDRSYPADVSSGRSTPTKSILKSPRPTSPGPSEEDAYVLLAFVLGFNGQGASEKVKSFLYRPVDILTGYVPRVNRDTCRLLEASQPHRRMVGEIAFQLDRRVLEFIIAGYSHNKLSFRYYGYSLTNILSLIKKEATNPHGELDQERELSLRRRLDYIMGKLCTLGYTFSFHAGFTQDMVNKYGLLNISSNDSAAEKYGLTDVGMIRLKLCQLLKTNSSDLDNMMVVFDCLCYLAHEDGRGTFIS